MVALYLRNCDFWHENCTETRRSLLFTSILSGCHDGGARVTQLLRGKLSRIQEHLSNEYYPKSHRSLTLGGEDGITSVSAHVLEVHS